MLQARHFPSEPSSLWFVLSVFIVLQPEIVDGVSGTSSNGF